MPGTSRRTAVAADEIVTENGTVAEVMRPDFNITREQLETVTDFASAMALATTVHGDIETSNAVRVAGENEKAKLVDLPMVLLEWHFIQSEKYQDNSDGTREYVEVLCVVENPDKTVTKWRFSDGGTGIAKQLRDWTDAHGGRSGGVAVPHGIRVSRYALDPVTRQPLTREAQRGYDRRNMNYPIGTTYYVDL